MRARVLFFPALVVCLVFSCGLCSAGQAQALKTVSCLLSSEANTNIIHIPVGYCAVGADVAVISAGNQPGLLTVLMGRGQAALPLEAGSQSHIDLEREQGDLPVSVEADNALAIYAVSVEVECVPVVK